MTNLDIIKHLALNKPRRLAELLEDIYCTAWNSGSYVASTGGANFSNNEIDSLSEWLYEDASVRGYYYEYELEEWSNILDNNTIEVSYPNGLTVEVPQKDAQYMWNTNNDYEVKNYPEKENKI